MASDGETVKVIVRCRPMNSREKDLKCNTVIGMEGKRGQCSIRNPDDKKAPPKMFTFDGAYFVDSTTENIYNEIAYPLVEVFKLISYSTSKLLSAFLDIMVSSSW